MQRQCMFNFSICKVRSIRTLQVRMHLCWVSWRPQPRHKQNTFGEKIYLLLLTVDLFVEFIGLPRKTNFVSIFSIHEFGCQSFGTIPIESCTIERDWKNNKKQYSSLSPSGLSAFIVIIIIKTPHLPKKILRHKKNLSYIELSGFEVSTNRISKVWSVYQRIFKIRSVYYQISKHRNLDQRIFRHRSFKHQIFKHRSLDQRIFKHRSFDQRIFKHWSFDQQIFKHWFDDKQLVVLWFFNQQILKQQRDKQKVFKYQFAKKRFVVLWIVNPISICIGSICQPTNC